jgi:hypothetical protein
VNGRFLTLALLGVVVLGAAGGCDQPRKEKPWERITRLRLHYKVSPDWYEVQKDKSSKPVLAMELTVTNTAKESLNQVTMVLHVTGSDGKDRVKMPLTLDVSHLSPGVPGKISVAVPGIEVHAGEEVVLQMQGQPSRAEMRQYPEYKSAFN